MGIGAKQRFARRAEAFEVDLMADAVARRRKFDALGRRHRLEIEVVVAVFRSALKHVMIDIRERQLGFDPGNAHRFKLEIGHRAGGVLSQRLVDADCHRRPRSLGPGNIMPLDDFLNYGTFGHECRLSS
ncbi:hypothetical protein SDC9_183743 [bioreactor metagenome]|uniref:Uncharacterized protein n=1 Tax=bioreactor metagenome TaxID=1076179 RepID=A0A645HJC5_9ZZZZ